jgi:universal stress protein E
MYGPPLDVLLQASRSRDADLMVLGATGQATPTLGTGTLATKFLRKAATKVLLVHAQQTRPFRRVLACVDFSETSRVAVTQAMHVAAQERAELFFLHVFRGEWKLWDSQLQSSALADFEKSHQAILAHNLRRFTGGPTGGNATYAVTEANTHGAGIAEFAHQIKADLVVLGSKGRTNLKYVLLGSTVERLLKEIPCSALVVRSATAPGG